MAHLPPDIAHHFACGLIRSALVDALVQSGFSDAKSWFSVWFCGLESPSVLTTHILAPAWTVADTLLVELSLSGWEPLAEAAGQLRRAARPDRDTGSATPEIPPSLAVEQARTLADQLPEEGEDDWPLAVLDRLHHAAAGSRDFAPIERERHLLSLPTGPIALEHASSGAALWALDLMAGSVLARGHAGIAPLPLPLPGAVRSEALKPELWPRERAILVADAAFRAIAKLTDLIEAAYIAVRPLPFILGSLRSTSRAPGLYRILAGFGPLRPIQIEKILRISKNGVRELVGTLVKAGLVEMTSHRGQAIVQPLPFPPGGEQAEEVSGKSASALSGPFAQFDAAMAEIDRLLARSASLDLSEPESD